MSAEKEILKIGLIVADRDRILLVRKKGGKSYILPGGKPERGESDQETLSREIEEELGCSIDMKSVVYLGSFSDTAADMNRTKVTVRLYSAALVGSPSPRAEIAQIVWFSPGSRRRLLLAPSIKNKIMPFLLQHGSIVGQVSQSILARSA